MKYRGGTEGKKNVQDPSHTPEQLGIHTLEIRESDLLVQNHLVETDNEVGIDESTMEDSQPEATTDELEVVEMLRVNTRRGVDLEGIVVRGGVLEETVEGVEHLMRE